MPSTKTASNKQPPSNKQNINAPAKKSRFGWLTDNLESSIEGLPGRDHTTSRTTPSYKTQNLIPQSRFEMIDFLIHVLNAASIACNYT